MSEDETPRPSLRFHDEIDYYESTDFGLISGEVDNDGWLGTGDAMATLALLRSDDRVEPVPLPVQVDGGPVTRGGRFTLPVANLTRLLAGETQISLIELSGADASGASEWSVWYTPIRNPFED